MAKKPHLARSFSLILSLFLATSMGITGMFLTAYGRTNQQAEQFEDWEYSEYLPLEDTVGVERVLEPAEHFLEIPDEQCLNATKEIRVATADGVEVPRQVYNVSTYESGYVAACNVVWQANCSAFSTAEYYIYWGNPAATEPTYATDIAVEISDVNITIWNTHYKASFTKEFPDWYGISDTMQYLYYKLWDNPTLNLGREDWHQLFQTVINVPPYWFGPFPEGKPIDRTNVTVEESGPVFIEVKAVYGPWKQAGVNSLVKTYRFYAYLPWFLLGSDFNLTGANYEHIQTESYLSYDALPYATYRKTDGSLTTVNLRPDYGDYLDWDGSWIDAETKNTTDNPVGLGFIGMVGTDPPYTGFRSDRGAVAPFQNGTLLEARQNLVILLHQGNYIVTEQLYNQTQKLLLPPPLLHAITSITILATIIDKVSGVASPGINVELIFQNGTVWKTETNELGTAIFRDIPSGNYTVRARGESVNMTVSLTRAYWSVRIRVMIPRFTGLIYWGIGIGVCVALIAVISVIRRRK